MKHTLLAIAVMVMSLSLACGAGIHPAMSANAGAPFKIVIDPGHNPDQGGALGVRGVYEVVYNDHIVAMIADGLRAAGYQVFVTRQPGEKIDLDQRARAAAIDGADLFLSIHHDSAQSQYLQKTTLNGQAAYHTLKPIAGYSIFVSERNPFYDASFCFAKQLGENMRAFGRFPSPHHHEPIKGENREFLDDKLGIYRFDDLIVLKKNSVPAVLLETGVIVDANDEAFVSNLENQTHIVQAIVKSVQAYRKTCQPQE